ncbi:hypothetical protein Pcinc_025501 [Petrolisthes cinctipes]|uniref:TMC domain-containing protein n=1 Tax=Petrolisthes cinctipes TaxID=88211 RepID=A0AAE1K9E4_PETCI|nr:hypothetical protein Pcinc_025501 [Petrolisthes cinctipes]
MSNKTKKVRVRLEDHPQPDHHDNGSDDDDDDDEGIVISFNSMGRGTVRRRASQRNRQRQQPPGTAVATPATTLLTHTSRRGSDTCLEVLPDLTQGVDEEETWWKLQQIRAQAVPMEEKRQLKRQLQDAPTLRTRGLAALKLSRRKFFSLTKSRLREIIKKVELWHWSLRYVEGNFGTGLVAFFTFIKWLLYLNLFTCILLTVFIILPEIFLKHPKDPCDNEEPDMFYDSLYDSSNSTSLPAASSPASSPSLPLYYYENTTTACCHLDYQKKVQETATTHTDKRNALLQLVQDGAQGTGILELSFLFYGFYPRHTLTYQGWSYNLPLAYLLVVVVSLALSLVLMVRAAARGLKESLRSSEGQFYQYCNLIFGGWDYCIENNKAAAIKKKAIFNELCKHLETERYNEEKDQRTRKERCRLYMVRLLVNLVVLALLTISFFAIFYTTTFSFNKLNALKSEGDEDELMVLLYEYLPSAVIITLNIIMPTLLSSLVKFEHYTPNFIMCMTLVRTVFLRLASLCVLLFSVYHRISSCPDADTPQCKCHVRREECGNLAAGGSEKGNQPVIYADSDQCEPMCWETYVGQQLYKLTLLDLVVMIAFTFLINLPRKCIGHKVLRGGRIGSAIGDLEFVIPKHVLDIVYGQTLCWLGMFYSPLLPAVTCIKLVLVFYIKYFDCTVNSSQSSQLYRTSRSNALFITVLLVSFIVTIIPVGYSIAEITPSLSCGPFRGLNTIWSEMVHVISEWPNWIQALLFFMGTAGFAVPAIILLMLAWYYYYAVAAANKHMVTLLKNQLVLEGHDKQFLLSRLDQMIRRQGEEGATRRSGGEGSGGSQEDPTGHSNDQTLEA